jgi:hypothetical protein
MDVNLAVRTAKTWLSDVLKEENPINVGLEEVEFDESNHHWLITLGFSRPWNSTRTAATVLTGEPSQRRSYRVVTVDDSDGKVISMKRREVVD